LKSKTPALLAALSANLIYGINYVVAKGIMPEFLQPRAIIFIRVIGATIVFWLISSFLKSEKVAGKDLRTIAIASIFGVVVNQILFFEGLNLSTPINASIIMICVPIAVLVFSKLIRGEKLSLIKIIGIVSGTLGAALLILDGGRLILSSSTAIGNLLIVINASSYALYLVMIKPMMMKYKAITVMRWVFLFGAIGILPFTTHIFLDSNWEEIPLNIWFSIAYVVIFTTILAYLMNNYSLSRISPTSNSAFIYLQPLFATAIAMAFGKDRPATEMILPVILIFLGVYFVSFYGQLKLRPFLRKNNVQIKMDK
jgi:drug/metabolite transporter (DMT)-like permease